MSESSLELSLTARARCKLCKEPIPKGAWRMKVSVASGRFDGDLTVFSHALCAAMRQPLPLLECLSEKPKLDATLGKQLAAIARTVRDRKLTQVIWRHATEARCLLELPKDVYVLFTERDGALIYALLRRQPGIREPGGEFPGVGPAARGLPVVAPHVLPLSGPTIPQVSALSGAA